MVREQKSRIPSSIASRVEKLREEIRKHDFNYYVLAQPTISDYEYDMLMKELSDLEKAYPEIITPDSPTQRVSGEPTKEFPQVFHPVPMLSLANTYNESELRDFDRRVQSLLGSEPYEYVLELKFDGVALRLVYEDGILRLAATRGDGERGDDVTSNARTIRTIPLKLNLAGELEKFANVEVRGEVYMNRADFQKMNQERENAGERTFANPRNATAGTLKLQDPGEVARRPLRFFAYYLMSSGVKLSTQWENLQIMKKLGLPVNEHSRLCKNIDEVIQGTRYWGEHRDELVYEIDGNVIKINSLDQQERLGAIARNPRWAIAYKFAARQAQTLLKGITLQVGRIGTITPVAELEPVLLAGSTISRATLHNEDYISEKDIRVGDVVIVEKSGDVIPAIVGVVKEKRKPNSKPFKFPSKCPVCGEQIIRPEGEAAYYCENYECPAQVRGRIEHFASRRAMDIEGMGEAVVDQLVSLGYLRNVADIYDLHMRKDELERLEHWGKKSVDNLITAIERSKERQFSRVLYALGIRHVGERTAQLIADHFGSMNNIKMASLEELQFVPEIGPKIAESIHRFFRDKRNEELLDRLGRAGLRFENEKKKVEGILSGKTFVLTGALSKYTRDEAKRKIELLGGKVTESVSKKTDFVVVGQNPGSKYDKALRLGLTILSEEELIKLFEGK